MLVSTGYERLLIGYTTSAHEHQSPQQERSQRDHLQYLKHPVRARLLIIVVHSMPSAHIVSFARISSKHDNACSNHQCHGECDRISTTQDGLSHFPFLRTFSTGKCPSLLVVNKEAAWPIHSPVPGSHNMPTS